MMSEAAEKINEFLGRGKSLRDFEAGRLEDKVKKIKTKPRDEQLKILWQWIHNKNIDFKQFKHIMDKKLI